MILSEKKNNLAPDPNENDTFSKSHCVIFNIN